MKPLRAKRSNLQNRHVPLRGTRDGKRASIEISAGGVVFQMDRRGPRIAMMMDPFHKWTFPKGHLQHGEDPLRAAVRETKEEIGIQKLLLVAPLGVLDFWFRRGTIIHKYVHMFLFEAPRGARLSPQKEELIRAVGWFSLREARMLMGYTDTKEVLSQAIRIIRALGRKRSRAYASHSYTKRTQSRQGR